MKGGLTLTNLMISFLVVAAVITGLQIFAGGVFTAYNTTTDIGFMQQYSAYSGTLNASQQAYSALEKPSTVTGLLVPPFVIAAWNSLKALISGIGTALTMPESISNTTIHSGYGFAGMDTFVGIAGAIALTSIIGYLIYVLLGRGGTGGNANV